MRICPKCGASSDDSNSFCISCGASYGAEDHGSPGNRAPALKVWLIIDAVLLVLLTCLGIFLPYPAQAAVALLGILGFIVMLVLLIAAFPAQWEKAPFLLGLAVCLILLAVSYFAFPKAELKSDCAAVITILTTSESPSSTVTLAAAPSVAPSASPAPSPSPKPTLPAILPSPSATPTPSAVPTPSAAPTPSAVPTPSATPTPSAAPTPSAVPTPSATPAPSAVPAPSVTPTPSAGAGVKPAGPAVKISAADLAAQYAENELAADRTYKDKLIEVCGVFKSLSVDFGRIQVLIDDGKYQSPTVICCVFDSKYADLLAGLRTGDRITIRGICSGKSDTVQIDQCALVE
jgi:hypothetical protein